MIMPTVKTTTKLMPLEKQGLVGKYVELLAQYNVATFSEPIGPGYPEVFDQVIDVEGYSEIRVWVHVFIRDYQTQPIGPDTQLKVRFMHQFVNGNSFDYDSGTVTTWAGCSYINGYIAKPIIGKKLRILGVPIHMPPGPYDIIVTYYLVP
jgi:hypothetical protein